MQIFNPKLEIFNPNQKISTLIRNVYEINPKLENFNSISEMWAKSTLIRMFYNLILCTASANHKISTLRSNVYGTNPNKKN